MSKVAVADIVESRVGSMPVGVDMRTVGVRRAWLFCAVIMTVATAATAVGMPTVRRWVEPVGAPVDGVAIALAGGGVSAGPSAGVSVGGGRAVSSAGGAQTARPSRSVAGRVGPGQVPVAAETLVTGSEGPGYGASTTAGTSASGMWPSVPLGPDDREDPDAVIRRPPDHDFGSGFHGDYGVYRRETSAPEQLRAAAAASNGCLIVGDSMATFVVKDMVEQLRVDPGVECAYDTWPGRPTEGTANALLDIGRRYGLPRRVVVFSGSNDIFNPPLFAPQMDRLLRGVGTGREVFWVTTFISRHPGTSRGDADTRLTSWINRDIRSAAARHPGVTVVSWDGLFAGGPETVRSLLKDGLHPNRAGTEAMIGVVRAAMSSP
ncbi:hypothetical protein KEM60_00236 [Austwickia sp. TVS 96-490-7B]|uniref:GDSL-type esterase/lipase family protein n=1 Tax=Austwickia sp. TVS 96-490-7B TaxID=2830843 RepID=UPI001C5A44E3|nr:GDSL-type esterase/lipase family protein [Austwickia sp. TVS 96-490-7B]MBW3084053.1 hypothetical protein [Austwickia sp. TVS 96-490-7B]